MQNNTESRQRKWDGTACEPDPHVWLELEKKIPKEVCRRTLATFYREQGFLLPFLSQTFQILPRARAIIPLYDHAPKTRSFEFDLIILTYLLTAQAIDRSETIINEKQIPGGETFFRGPHTLNTGPMEKLYGENREGFLAAGKKLNGREKRLGDAAIYLPVLPRVPVTLILWTKDDEFPAQITVNFDNTISSHLPLDIIWALINVVSTWMTRPVCDESKR